MRCIGLIFSDSSGIGLSQVVPDKMPLNGWCAGV